MPFPKPEPGIQMRGKVNGELWSAGSCWTVPDEMRRKGERELFAGILRCQGGPRWECSHSHQTAKDARLCAAAELGRRLRADAHQT